MRDLHLCYCFFCKEYVVKYLGTLRTDNKTVQNTYIGVNSATLYGE